MVVPLCVPEDRFAAAMAACAFASRAGLSRKAALQVGLVAAELAANAVWHGGGGVMRLTFTAMPHPGVELHVVDRGRGLRAIDFADGFSEGQRLGPDSPRKPGQGLGVGLGTVRRLMDEVRSVMDECGRHCVVATRWTER